MAPVEKKTSSSQQRRTNPPPPPPVIGDGGGMHAGDKGGNDLNWSLTDFIPAWNTYDVFRPDEPVPFRADPKGKLPQYLPLYINNDGLADGADAIVLSLDSDKTFAGKTRVGFSQEIYVLEERWDTEAGILSSEVIPDDFSTYLRIKRSENSDRLLVSTDDESSLKEPELNVLNTMFRVDEKVDGKTRIEIDGKTIEGEFVAPKLVSGSTIREALVIIKDSSEGSWPPKNDTLIGTPNKDTFNGGEGNDFLVGGAGDDCLRGGKSDDVNPNQASSILDFDYLNGGSGNDILKGEEGSDVIDGMMGNDLLDGGEGNDVMRGGTGNDTYIVDDAEEFQEDRADIIIDKPGTGIETVESYVDWTLEEGLDYLTLRDKDGTRNNIDGTGNQLNNIIKGNSFDNRLNGYGTTKTDKPQIDKLTGGAGADTFILGGDWGVSYVEKGDGYALINDWNVLEDTIQVAGDRSQYDLVSKSVKGIGTSAQDTEIYYIGDGPRERIGILIDTISVSSDSTDRFKNFSFV